ncbi:phosphoenolpyruvate-protein phosphotransferase [Treponema primitia ZAS-2]|uniref:Phosphoenolpyruvate-protein phosphotransferase n=1 Tax=Treponema primitia (strain ATCC BAA-887 / DSM 12427 / ZAS-2) TaxID=545694 RepID=F5YM43_TREPZ|nr:phosphoenolpyruvate--protein phosphotransferase [Treponema primitia]AEF83726.1 phosphoenolpyruvate-protein phosphotransferase [Treponema primitia ZAS-2]
MILTGIGVTEKIIIGTACVLREIPKTAAVPVLGIEEFRTALETSRKQIEALISSVPADQGAIFASHLNFLEDPEFTQEMAKLIEQEGWDAVRAVEKVSGDLQQSFREFEEPYLQERAADVRDLGERILRNLLGKEETDLSRLQEQTILVAADLSPSQTARIDGAHVTGLVTEQGGSTSHTVILAKARDLAAVVGCTNILASVQTGDSLIVDALSGTVIINADPEQIQIYRDKIQKLEAEQESRQNMIPVQLFRTDGRQVVVAANIGSEEDARQALEKGANGVGLFRTEFLFLDRDRMPSEEEQYQVYRRVTELFAGKSVVIRTLDIGGDKQIPYLLMPAEENPFLGVRAIRLCLKHEELFCTQLKALLRAALAGDLKIMFPMIGSLGELHQAQELLRRCKAELSGAGIPFRENLEIGMMIEIPAAAIQADEFAREVDFFSIGTNDLTQYTLAVDRGNPELNRLYDFMHPAVTTLIKHTIEAAHRQGIPCFMCGEMASSPEAIPLLAGYGLDEFSVNLSDISRTKMILLKQEGIRHFR